MAVRLGPEPAAVELVPAGLHDGVDLHAVQPELRIGAEALDASPRRPFASPTRPGRRRCPRSCTTSCRPARTRANAPSPPAGCRRHRAGCARQAPWSGSSPYCGSWPRPRASLSSAACSRRSTRRPPPALRRTRSPSRPPRPAPAPHRCVAVKPTVSRTFGRWIGRKPDSSNATWIDANRQRRQTVLAHLVRDGRHLRHLQGGTGRRHRHAGEHGAALVGHLPDDARARALAGAAELEIGNKNKLANMKTSPHRTSDVLLCMVVLSRPHDVYTPADSRGKNLAGRCPLRLRGRPTAERDDKISNERDVPLRRQHSRVESVFACYREYSRGLEGMAYQIIRSVYGYKGSTNMKVCGAYIMAVAAERKARRWPVTR